MSPFKIFIFATVILMVAFLYRYENSMVKSELPPLPQKTDEQKVKSDSVGLKQTFRLDSAWGFFEGCKPDSCLLGFIRQLNHSKDSLVRITFFGDSQLEGDFYTMHVRKAFQKIYGGNGIGYMPAEMYFNTTEKVAVITQDFEKYVVHTAMNESGEFGLYGRYFLPAKAVAELRIKNRNANHRYQKLKIIYSGKAHLIINEGKQIHPNLTLDSDSVAEMDIDFETTPTDLKLIFLENEHLKLYGILLDPENGVVVDHVPFRGNLNLMLNYFGRESVMQMGNLLKPSLVVLQYGLNVIPDVRPNYENYRIAVQRDIQLLKKFQPNASIVVIGAPDMAHKVNGEMRSYENIDQIIEAQRLAAKNESVAFWNMRNAMGGNGSVIEWVDEELARSDYAHLKAEGSEKIAKIFTADLLLVINQNSSNNAGIAEK